MTLVATTFNDLVTFTRGTGATRINAAGLIVGVDFSSTSNTIGTGAKTFTLAADANVNRDWPVGSAVRVVDQVSANTMEGTVTTYTPSTQELVLNIASVTGAGTFTNWRIGSLEVRRDADGVLREPLRSNLVTFSSDFANTAYTKDNSTVTAAATLSLKGSVTAQKLLDTVSNTSHRLSRNVSIGANGVISILAKAAEYNFLTLVLVGSAIRAGVNFNLTTGATSNTFVLGSGVVNRAYSERLSNGWFRLILEGVSSTFGTFYVALAQNSTFAGIEGEVFTGTGTSGVFIDELQVESSTSVSSIIPTTTVAVTRNADTFTFTPAAIAKFRQGQGALIVEANASDAGTAQRAALRLTGPAGEIRLGKQGVATSGNFTKMAEGGDVQLLGTSSDASGSISNNGLEYTRPTPISTRTGLASNLNLGGSQAPEFVYNGVDQFGLTPFDIEATVNDALTSIDEKGVGVITLNGAHHNGSRFLITTGAPGTVVLSTDGLSYRRVNTPVITQACNEVTSGMVGPTLRNVIVGNVGTIFTSDDNGETWIGRVSGTVATLSGASYGTLSAVTRFLACGSGNVILSSTDAITWANGTGQVGAFNDVHVANGIAVAVGATGVIYTSTNGTSWTAATSSGVVTTQTLNGVHYNASANLWVAVGANGTIITAVDPTGTWTLQTSGVGNTLNEVNYFNGLWIVVGAQQTILTSPNAVTWTLRANNLASSTENGIAHNGSRLIVTGTGGTFASSEDGLTYTSRTNNNATLNGIAYGAGVYVSVGNAVNGSGYIATIDGAGTVTRRVSGTTGSLISAKYLNAAFYAGFSGVAGLLRSTDATTWSFIPIVNIATTGALAFGSGVHVTGGNAARTSFSINNGLTWSTSIAGTAGVSTGVTFNDADFANGTFVMVGSLGEIITGTTDGASVSWTRRTSGTTQSLTSVIYSQRDQRWYAAGNAGTLLYSEDNGVTWASVNNAGFGAVSNTTLQVSKLTNQWASGVNKIALSYNNNSVVLALNGIAVSDTLASIPSVTAGVLGETFNGKITSVRFRPEPLTEAQAATITEL